MTQFFKTLALAESRSFILTVLRNQTEEEEKHREYLAQGALADLGLAQKHESGSHKCAKDVHKNLVKKPGTHIFQSKMPERLLPSCCQRLAVVQT
eukprot:1882311-Karenia_brevis.AAC.1